MLWANQSERNRGMVAIAYILTRPLGASFADWFGKDRSAGGLGYGTEKVSVIFTRHNCYLRCVLNNYW